MYTHAHVHVHAHMHAHVHYAISSLECKTMRSAAGSGCMNEVW